MTDNEIEYLENDGKTESFEVLDETDKRTQDVISYDDLMNNFKNQFVVVHELGIDKTDYIKVFCVKFLGMDSLTFDITKVKSILNDDILETYETFLEYVELYLYNYCGIKLGMQVDFRIELIHRLYTLFIINPEQFLIDLALYNNFYEDDRSFRDYIKDGKVQQTLGNIDDDLYSDPSKYIELLNKLNSTIDKDGLNLELYKKSELFRDYLKMCLYHLENDGTEEIFEKLNKMNPSETYEELERSRNAYHDYAIEDDILISLLEHNIINAKYNTISIEKMSQIFFERLKEYAILEFQVLSE
jgi:hypothetical protein